MEDRAPCTVFVFEDAQGIHIVVEKDVCRFLLDAPSLTLAQAWTEKRKPGGEAQKKS